MLVSLTPVTTALLYFYFLSRPNWEIGFPSNFSPNRNMELCPCTQKTNARSEVEVTMLENNIVVYKFVQDLHFFITGGEEENEVILATVLQGFVDAVGLLLRGNVEKREALEYLDLILLCIDEIVDGGIILETDANIIAGKVASHSTVADGLSEQTFSQALATAREHLARSLLK
ncbi:hypothetical protein OIU78_018148 [Salix suchowensis]|nr:hypothetical protein OIU78_018148 [Salix suchowensis]